MGDRVRSSGAWQEKRMMLTVRMVRRDLLVMAVVCSSMAGVWMADDGVLKGVRNVREELEACRED